MTGLMVGDREWCFSSNLYIVRFEQFLNTNFQFLKHNAEKIHESFYSPRAVKSLMQRLRNGYQNIEDLFLSADDMRVLTSALQNILLTRKFQLAITCFQAVSCPRLQRLKQSRDLFL